MDAETQAKIDAARAELGVPNEVFPKSVAIIMDGNGRWASQRGLPRPFGHREGAKVVRKIVTEAARLGLEALTLYSFSQQNWSRPADEVDALMHLYADYLVHERKTVMEHNVQLRHLGSRQGLPKMVLDELDESVRVSSTNTGMYLGLALNYGSREEILRAVEKLMVQPPAELTEAVFSAALDTADMPDPDLLIRTAGELRISNFLLWQISYAEFYVTPTYWPDFGAEDLHEAIRAYAKRNRRFGGLDKSGS